MIDIIKAIVAELWVLRQKPDSSQVRYEIGRLERTLAELRRGATFYGTYSSLTNIEVLGEAWFKQMRRDLPPAEFRTSILCLPVDQVTDGFYNSFSKRHIYNATDFCRASALSLP